MIANHKKKSRVIALSCVLCIALIIPLLFTSPVALTAQAQNIKPMTSNIDDITMLSFPPKGALALDEQTISRLTDYFKSFANILRQYGSYDQWPGQAKIQLAEMMIDQGLVEDKEMAEKFSDDTLNVTEKNKAAEEIIRSCIGEAPIEVHNIMENALGVIAYWPYPIKALKTSLELGIVHPDERYYLPQEGDASSEMVLKNAFQALTERYPSAVNELPVYTPDISFLVSPLYGTEPVWMIAFRHPDVFGISYEALFNREGTTISLAAHGHELISPSGGHSETSDDYDKLIEGDLTREQAIVQALVLLNESSYTDGDMEVYKLDEVLYRLDDSNNSEWFLSFVKPGEKKEDESNILSVKMSGNGKKLLFITKSPEQNNELEVRLNTLFEENGSFFAFWTVEEKFQFKNEWRAIVDARPQSPINKDGYLAYLLSKEFLLPMADDLPLENAIESASKELKNQVKTAEISDYVIAQSFLLNDQGKRVWRIFYIPIDRLGTDRGYTVDVEEASGEVISLIDMAKETSIFAGMFE